MYVVLDVAVLVSAIFVPPITEYTCISAIFIHIVCGCVRRKYRANVKHCAAIVPTCTFVNGTEYKRKSSIKHVVYGSPEYPLFPILFTVREVFTTVGPVNVFINAASAYTV